MSEFLTGNLLSQKIKSVLAGPNPRMSVAFLGPAWTKEVFQGPLPGDLRIICDLAMRMTPRNALKAAGAPNNSNLRHLPEMQLHGKVYLSERGAVVCSANASVAALSCTKRIEDGVWLDPSSDTFRQVATVFEDRFGKSEQVDQVMLDAAPDHVAGPQPDVTGRTIVEALRDNIDAFKGIYFVCSNLEVGDEIPQLARREMDVDIEGKVTKDHLKYDYFQDWKTDEKNWPKLFFAIHIDSEGKLSVTKQSHIQLVQTGSGQEVFISRLLNWKATGPEFADLPGLATNKDCQLELQKLIGGVTKFQSFAGKIFTSSEFCRQIDRLGR